MIWEKERQMSFNKGESKCKELRSKNNEKGDNNYSKRPQEKE